MIIATLVALLPVCGSRIIPGPAALVDERGACGVGFIAQPGRAASHDVITRALEALRCMEHRGACAADSVSGDGAGVLTDVPWALLRKEVPEVAKAKDTGRPIGVAMLFLSRDTAQRAVAKAVVEEAANTAGFDIIAWRDVPVDEVVLGKASAATVPHINQAFVTPHEAFVNREDGTFTGYGFDESQADHSKVRQGSKGMERAMYLLRRRLNGMRDERGLGNDGLYVCSLSSKTITYKGMMVASALSAFYKDLADERFVARFAIYHRRFSTNTDPKWRLAQPMRLMAHNGEINTLLGNVNWMRARAAGQETCDISALLEAGVTGGGLAAGSDLARCDTSFAVELGPLVDTNFSDSANLDSVFELYARAGRGDLAEALMVLLPQAFENGQLNPDTNADAALKAFFDFHAPLQEAWDGPALVVFGDGNEVGAALDRNGLRPARFTRMLDGTVYLMSETGVVQLDEGQVAEKGRLGPGQLITVDLSTGECFDDATIKARAATAQPWRARVEATQSRLARVAFDDPRAADYTVQPQVLVATQSAFGWSSEDVAVSVADMARLGVEATFSMGDDAPIAALSKFPHVPYDYLRQRFAQVTNPPIDPLREGEVMSLTMALGRRGHVLNNPRDDGSTQLVVVESPVLNAAELDALVATPGLKVTTISTLYPRPVSADVMPRAKDAAGLKAAIAALTAVAVAAVQDGADVLVLTDKPPNPAVGMEGGQLLYVPPLVAVGAVHHGLIGTGLRMRASLVIETGQCWTTHHVACLVGFGASAVYPYLAFDSTKAWLCSTMVQKMMNDGRMEQLSESNALSNVRIGLEKGLLKIMSKMGISLLSSYHGAQIFEALGLGGDLLDHGGALYGTPSRVGGLDTADLGRELLTFVDRAIRATTDARLVDDGFIRPKGSKEHHSNSPQLAKQLHKAVRNKDAESFRKWSEALGARPLTALRDLLDLSSDGRMPVHLDEVEPASTIMRRFCTGGMSLGALSREAHETLAIAFNRVSGKSNSGEGGEDQVRFRPLPQGDVDSLTGRSVTLPHFKGGLKEGDDAGSRIKQVASGRFGVTPAYLVSAKQLEIKVAQGAKPGEGGQLPGKKVSDYIAKVRQSTPGVTLISPPPHHDVYSIEDLAQLIFDLKAINPTALVSVKLVATPGIGTVSCGVAKANADVIQVSGHDGGTGASPLSSIKHAGSSWELGIAETHRALIDNDLRASVLLRVDGGIRTGRDVLIAALLGGEEFGFGTTAMIAAGCVMARVCHLNTCPVGVTTQNPELRAKFPGVPEDIVSYLAFVAEEVRWYLSAMGMRSLAEAVGQGGDVLRPRAIGLGTPSKTSAMTTDFMINLPLNGRNGRRFVAPSSEAISETAPRPNLHGEHFDDRAGLVDAAIAAVAAARQQERPRHTEVIATVANTDRAVGARLSGEVARVFGDAGLPALADGSTLRLRLSGAAGQSLAAWLLPGCDIVLEGEANDYVCKGMHGGTVSIMPPPALVAREAAGAWRAEDNVICGNTCLFGATGGRLFVRGRAGERFAVRNSGAVAVVEGTGDHACEYMTAGAVAVLGSTGRNVGAGMTGGLAFFLEEPSRTYTTAGGSSGGDFIERVNLGAVSAQRVKSKGGAALLKGLLEQHLTATGSAKAAALLAQWPASLGSFWQLVPESEAKKNTVVDPTPAGSRLLKAHDHDYDSP